MTNISSLKDPSKKVSGPELEIKRPTVVDVFLGEFIYKKTKDDKKIGKHKYTFRGKAWDCKDDNIRSKVAGYITNNINGKEAKGNKYTNKKLTLDALKKKVYKKGDKINVDLLEMTRIIGPLKSATLGLEYKIFVKVKNINEGKIKVNIKAVNEGLIEKHKNLTVLFKDAETEDIKLDGKNDKWESDESLIFGKVTLRPKSEEGFKSLQETMIEHQTSDPEMSKVRDCHFYFTVEVSGHPKNKLLRYEGKKIGHTKLANAFNYDEDHWTVIDNYWQDPVKNPVIAQYQSSGVWRPATSIFGMTRNSKKKAHTGLDIFGDIGTPLYASLKGKISRKNIYSVNESKLYRSWGNIIAIAINSNDFINRAFSETEVSLEKDEGEQFTMQNFSPSKTKRFHLKYAHILKSFVKKGDTVYPGQKIALLGCSGVGFRSCAPHLHFEIADSETGTKPQRLNPRYCIKVDFPTEESNDQKAIKDIRYALRARRSKILQQISTNNRKIKSKVARLLKTKVKAQVEKLKKEIATLKESNIKNRKKITKKRFYEKNNQKPIIKPAVPVELGQSLEVENPQSLKETE